MQELTAADYDGIWTSGIDYTVVNAFDTVGKEPVPVVGADNNEFLNQLLQGTARGRGDEPGRHRRRGCGHRHPGPRR